MNALKVCIIGLKCHDHLTGAEMPRYLGGIETQLATLARGLVDQGCDVSVITYDHNQPDGERVDGVRVIKSHVPDAGLRVLRNIYPRMTGLLGAMKRAGADIHLQMGAGIETGQTALGCRLLGRPFVFCLASDGDFGAHLDDGPWGLEGRIYRFGLNHANLRVTQTETQRQGLRAATGLESTIIPMAIVPPTGVAVRDGSPHVLWVGRITPEKRLDWLLDAARLCPEAVFDIVGTPNHQSDHANRLMEQARQMHNVVVHGRAPASKLAELYAGAALLCCTSGLEGFPTTFLEAWSIGLPVVTTFDPDGVVKANGLGVVVRNPHELAAGLNDLLHSPEVRTSFGGAARRYFESHHSIGEVSRRFRDVLENRVRNPQPVVGGAACEHSLADPVK